MEQPQRFLSSRTADSSGTNFLASFGLVELLQKVQNRSFGSCLIFLLKLPTKMVFVVMFSYDLESLERDHKFVTG